jgi:hypothetical protein
MKNDLHHSRRLSNMKTDVNYRRLERSWQRSDNGYNSCSQHHRDACRRYNKAFRKASKLQLSRYNRPPQHSNHEADLPESNSWADC